MICCSYSLHFSSICSRNTGYGSVHTGSPNPHDPKGLDLILLGQVMSKSPFWFMISAFGLMNSPFYLLIVNEQVLGQVILSMFLILNSFHYHPVLATHLPTPQWRLEVRAAFTRELRPQVG